VPLEQATACSDPTTSENAFSKELMLGPVVSQSPLRTSTTADMSDSSIVCRP